MGITEPQSLKESPVLIPWVSGEEPGSTEAKLHTPGWETRDRARRPAPLPASLASLPCTPPLLLPWTQQLQEVEKLDKGVGHKTMENPRLQDSQADTQATSVGALAPFSPMGPRCSLRYQNIINLFV